jgi:hypothetical protein
MKDVTMISRLMNPLSSRRGRDLLRTAALLALVAAPVAAQDNDEDGTLPKNHDTVDPTQGVTAPAEVGIVAEDFGDEVLDEGEARLVARDVDGPTVVNLEAQPEEAMFVTSGQLDLSMTDEAVGLQGSGELVLEPGFEVTFEAAPEALVRSTLLVIHAADAELHELLAGGVAPVALLVAGDMAAVDLGSFQSLVDQHAEGLQGLHVSLVDVSIDAWGDLRASAVRLAPDATTIEFVTD